MNNDVLTKIVRKFVISIFTLLYAFIALTQATFAWITLGNELHLEEAELSVITDSGFYVSVDGENYTTSLTNAMLESVMESNGFVDITSTDGKTFYEKTGERQLDSFGNYITFPLWFKTKDKYVKELYLVDNVSDEISYEVVLNQEKDKRINGTFIVSKGIQWVSDVEFDYGKKHIRFGDTLNCYAADAMRISINEEQLEEKFNLPEKEELLSFIYDPSEETDPNLGYGASTGAYEYYTKKKTDEKLVLPTVFPKVLNSLSKIENPYWTTDGTSMCARFQEKVENGETWKYTKVRVNIWLEGWDADCFNSILDDELLIQLRFKGSQLDLNKLKK